MALPTITVTPQAAIEAYRRAGDGGDATSGDTSFGAVLQSSLQGVLDTGHAAESAATDALSGKADVTSVVTAISKAELALQTTVVIRDRVVQAYQDIMKMPI